MIFQIVLSVPSPLHSNNNPLNSLNGLNRILHTNINIIIKFSALNITYPRPNHPQHTPSKIYNCIIVTIYIVLTTTYIPIYMDNNDLFIYKMSNLSCLILS